MDIGYFSYFLSLYLLDKETQHDTYLNPCSGFTLNFLDSIYSQMANDLSYLNSNLCLPTMPYSVITIVAILTCQSARESLAICFFIVSYLNIILKYTKL